VAPGRGVEPTVNLLRGRPAQGRCARLRPTQRSVRIVPKRPRPASYTTDRTHLAGTDAACRVPGAGLLGPRMGLLTEPPAATGLGGSLGCLE
jgi:hypothetical protein